MTERTARGAERVTRWAWRTVRRSWGVLRVILLIGAVALVWWELDAHRSELSGLSVVFDHLVWLWIPIAVAAEAASLTCFAALQRTLLRSGGLSVRWPPLLKMTVASLAMTNSLPGGVAASAVYGFRWFRRFGADGTLAAWSLVGSIVASMLSLSLVATAGLALAAEEGASLDLIPVLVGVLLLTIAVGALFVYERPLSIIVRWVVHTSRATIGRPRGDAVVHIQRIVEWCTVVRLNLRQVLTAIAWAAGNWLFDCGCFAMMFLAVDSTIPWKGLLLAYGAGQLAASLPITPGGLGVVEGSITIALVAFGGDRIATVDAVLMYRLVSFWLVLVVGWGSWGEMALEVRRGRWRRAPLTTPINVTVLAGPTATTPADPRGVAEEGA